MAVGATVPDEREHAGRSAMNWIERLFGISPDAGNGSAEVGVAIAIALVLVLGFVGKRFIRRANLGRSRPSR
jgi:hypothetical protein